MTIQNNTPYKRCPQCGNEYPITNEFFYTTRKKGKLYFQSYCKTCNKAKGAEWKRQHPEQNRIHSRKWRRKFPEKANEISRNYHSTHPEQVRRSKKEWKRTHVAVVKQSAQKYRSVHADKKRSEVRNRRALKANAPGSHTATDIDCLYINQRGLCAYCSTPLHGKYHVDHVVPLSRGGTDYADNLVLACATCNTSKGDKLISEWVR